LLALQQVRASRAACLAQQLTVSCTAFAPQARLWDGLGAISRTVNERDRRSAVLSIHNAELRAASSSGDEMSVLQVLQRADAITTVVSQFYLQLRLKQILEIDTLSRARIMQVSSHALHSAVCPNTAYV
jgi:hypothetical protein